MILQAISPRGTQLSQTVIQQTRTTTWTVVRRLRFQLTYLHWLSSQLEWLQGANKCFSTSKPSSQTSWIIQSDTFYITEDTEDFFFTIRPTCEYINQYTYDDIDLKTLMYIGELSIPTRGRFNPAEGGSQMAIYGVSSPTCSRMSLKKSLISFSSCFISLSNPARVAAR